MKATLFFLLSLSILFSCDQTIKNQNLPDSQLNCEQQKLPDSLLLLDFSKKLNSIMTKGDKEGLSALFHFPFYYDSCNQNRDHPTRLISKQDFLNTEPKYLFGTWFSETVSKGYLYHQLYLQQAKDRCRLVFDFPLAIISGTSECKRQFISVEKIEGSYKFVSSWQSE